MCIRIRVCVPLYTRLRTHSVYAPTRSCIRACESSHVMCPLPPAEKRERSLGVTTFFGTFFRHVFLQFFGIFLHICSICNICIFCSFAFSAILQFFLSCPLTGTTERAAEWKSRREPPFRCVHFSGGLEAQSGETRRYAAQEEGAKRRSCIQTRL